MADQADATACPKCHELERRIAALEAQLAAAQKNSATSSKPPSSDIVKPPPAKPNPQTKRKIGAQPGHVKHERVPFGPDQVDISKEYCLDCCPECGGALELLAEPARVIQQVELPEKRMVVTEHRSRVCRCEKCQLDFTTPIPQEVQNAGLAGPQLTALVGYLKGACHCSFSTIRKYLRDVIGVTISRGQLRKQCGKVGESLDAAYADLFAALPEQLYLNIDETGHKEKGKGMWTWCFRAPLFTLFHIDPSRGSDVLVKALGLEFDGVIGCDYFSAYRKYMRLNENVVVQFCLAHLIRDVKFLVTHPNQQNRAYGSRVLACLSNLFSIIHRREAYATEEAFLSALTTQGFGLWRQAITRVPASKEAQNLANRFRKHGKEYIRFITTPGIEPTNNLAEQAIRFVVLDRRVTQGTRGAAGRRWCERIWTAIATCTQHGVSVFKFLSESIQAYLHGLPGPSLLPPSALC
jgi:transposase